ncbi:type II secretion system F family protein [Aestuariimicrobium soli]|uniref:type II secretion system F family protein n=1 Tax=Aestuariimicrobium soli TaxID=2035834 RepID=UPI003EBEADFE
MAVVVALLAALAVWLLVQGQPDPRRLERASPGARAAGDRGRGSRRQRVGSWLVGRPDAPSLGRRAFGGATLACLGWLTTGGLGVPWGLRALLVLAAGVGLVVALGHVEPARVARDRERQRGQLPATIDLLAAALAAGVAPRVAAAEVARVVPEPSRSALLVVCAETDVGRSDADAWRALGTSPRWEAVWGRVGRDLARSARHGIPVQEVLVVHAARARQSRRAALERRARAVGVSSVVPLMVCYLPAFMAVGVAPIILGLGLQYLH